jgi:DNA-binding CsgD family transcriptional regulator/tetratricopeptide (TPR) repeat protein
MDLLERDTEMAILDDALNRASKGSGLVALVLGEAGIGKTRLVREFVDRHQGEVRVLWGACDDLSTPRTLGPFRDISYQTDGRLEQAIASADRTLVFEAALEAISAERWPTVTVVEDVHWADSATLDVLKFLARRIQSFNALLIATYREEDVPPDHPLRSALGDIPQTALIRVSPSPLSRAAVAAMGSDYDGSIEDLLAATRGNPFLVTEAIQHPESDVSQSTREAVAARVARLGPAARAIVDLASVVPGTIERWLLGSDRESELDSIEEARDRGILEFDEKAVWFRHELVRRAVEASVSDTSRRELNALVLSRLEAAGAEIERMVHHAAEARDGTAVMRFGPTAARHAAAASSHREALSHYRTVMRHLDLAPESEQAVLLSEYGVECYLANSPAEGLTAVGRALERWRALGDSLHEGETLRWQSRLHWWLGHGEEAERTGEAAVEVLQELPPSTQLAMAYSNLGQLHMLAQEFEPTEHWATKAIELARRLDDHDTLAHALNNLGSAQARVGDMKGLHLLTESLEISLREGFDDHAGRAYANLIWTLLDVRDYDLAAQYLERGIDFARRREISGSLYYMTAERARMLFELGEWSAAERDAQWVLDRPEEPGITQMSALAVLARLQVRSGHPDADTSLDAAWDLVEHTGELQRLGPVSAARAERAWLGGDLDETREAVAPAYALGRGVRQPWMTDELAFWMWRANALESAPSTTTPFALQVGGDYEGAAAAWQELGCPYEQAMALMDSDDPNRLLEALAILTELGALPATMLLRRKLRGLGIQGVPRGPRATTRENPAGLTSRQAEVLELLGEGLTNPQIAERLFLSPKTVEHHVSAILTKLDVPSREDASIKARSLGITRN